MTRHHVVITGTGRAGTTFLVQLFARLGLDTGLDAPNMTVDEDARAGCEHDIRLDNAPYIVKSPKFCDYAAEVLRRDDITIDHVLVPMRDLLPAAQSRRYVQKTVSASHSALWRVIGWIRPARIPGGVWHTRGGSRQEAALLQIHYDLMLALSNSAVPVILLRYPRIVTDSAYLHMKLEPVLTGISVGSFERAFRHTVRPELVHRFSDDDTSAE